MTSFAIPILYCISWRNLSKRWILDGRGWCDGAGLFCLFVCLFVFVLKVSFWAAVGIRNNRKWRADGMDGRCDVSLLLLRRKKRRLGRLNNSLAEGRQRGGGGDGGGGGGGGGGRKRGAAAAVSWLNQAGRERQIYRSLHHRVLSHQQRRLMSAISRQPPFDWRRIDVGRRRSTMALLLSPANANTPKESGWAPGKVHWSLGLSLSTNEINFLKRWKDFHSALSR